jgi:hypothetical protein
VLNGELRTALDREVAMLVAAYGLIGKDAICDCAIGTIRADKFVRVIEVAHRMNGVSLD